MQEVIACANKILNLIEETESYEYYEDSLNKKKSKLFSDYQKGRYTYFEYQKLLSDMLKGRSMHDWKEYYRSYVYSLLKKVESLNMRIFYLAYQEGIPKPTIEKPVIKPIKVIKKIVKPKPVVKPVEKPVLVEKLVEVPEKLPALKEKKRWSFFTWLASLFKHKKPKAKVVKLKEIKPKEKPSIVFEKKPLKPEPGIKHVTIFAMFREVFQRMFKRPGPISKETIIEPSTLKLELLKERKPKEIKAEMISTTVLAEEARRIKAILERRKGLKIYQPSFFGSMANVTIKKTSILLLDTFPEFFKSLYNALRLANIKILSNTYVNMMVLAVVLSGIFSIVFFSIFFALLKNPFYMLVTKTFIMFILGSGVAFLMFYAYPFMKIKARRRSINTNLPFAINHMAAVAASGVPPTKMFKLIVESKEYGEISVEVEKVVEYVELFGYDLLTAIKSVAATTPSPQFKEFLEGMVSTVESGSDIKGYLVEKSEEAMLNYELERQKYIETISTYSDIYTGVLIAAPLFFVAALSLVSMLGGAIGGVDVDVLIVLGTYIAIPLLNIFFIIFLESTQPEA